MTISLRDFDRCCRCCLAMPEALKPIFGACLDEMLIKVMNLQITRNDGYPQQICSQCILKLSSAHIFYLTIMKSQKTLGDILKAAEVKKQCSVEGDDCDLEKEYTTQREINSAIKVLSVQHFVSAEDTPIKQKRISCILKSDSKDSSESDNEESIQCPQCEHTARDQVQLKVHLQSHLVGPKDQSKVLKDVCEQLCNYCGARFRLRTSLHKHLRVHRGRHHACPHCPRTFAEASSLSVHLVSHSSEPKPFHCACGSAFSQKSSLKKHEKQHEARDKLRCADCWKSFLHKCSLQRHRENVHSTQECAICNTYFIGKKVLDAHMRHHKAVTANLKTAEQTDNTLTEEINIQPVTVKFLCLICNKMFLTREGLEV